MKSKREWLRSNKASDRVDGFTLVELLVVITIIGTIKAMIMPAAGAAIRRARIGVCASNLNQVMSMNVLYASENSGYVVPSGKTRHANLTYDMGAGAAGAVLFAEDFSGHWRMSEAHINKVNIGFVSGGVSLRHYDPNAYPFKNIVAHSARASSLKRAYRWH